MLVTAVLRTLPEYTRRLFDYIHSDAGFHPLCSSCHTVASGLHQCQPRYQQYPQIKPMWCFYFATADSKQSWDVSCPLTFSHLLLYLDSREAETGEKSLCTVWTHVVCHSTVSLKPSLFVSCRSSTNEVKNLLQSLPRTSEPREMLFEDRTRAHADHIGQGFERQTTAAVGVLKAVCAGER